VRVWQSQLPREDQGGEKKKEGHLIEGKKIGKLNKVGSASKGDSSKDGDRKRSPRAVRTRAMGWEGGGDELGRKEKVSVGSLKRGFDRGYPAREIKRAAFSPGKQTKRQKKSTTNPRL